MDKDSASWRLDFRRRFAAIQSDVLSRENPLSDKNKYAELIIAAVCAGDQNLASELMSKRSPKGGPYTPLAAAHCEPLEKWCMRHDTSYQTIFPSEKVEIEPTSTYTYRYVYETEPSSFVSLQDASWIPGWDFVIGSDGVVLSDSGYMPLDMAHGRRSHCYLPGPELVSFYCPESEIIVEEEALFLSEPNQGHFGHWMVDFLPRLKGRDIARGPLKVVVPNSLSKREIESLNFFGVAISDLIPCSDKFRYRFRKLNIYRPGRYAPPNPLHVAYVRQNISRHRPQPSRGNRIYASRTSVNTRMIKNVKEFNQVLFEEGFIEVDMADLTIAEQQSLLSDAEIIVGAFGTNLFSIYFAPPNCTIIELTDQPQNDPTIPHTSSFLGIKHQFLICESTGSSLGQPAKHAFKKDKDVHVDCSELRRRLREISQVNLRTT